MEILILGVVLLVLGVGATIIYDKHKAFQTDMEAKIEAGRVRREQAAKEAAQALAQAKAAAKKTKVAVDDTLDKLFKGSSSGSYTTKTTTKTYTKKPISQKKKLPSASSPVSADDVSINSQLTVQELIAKIEAMKKK